MFECDKCGNCCRHLDQSEIYKDLDMGNGTCRYLSGNLCSIYDDRPSLCRIDECYEKFFSEIYTREEYYRLNEEACKRLRTE